MPTPSRLVVLGATGFTGRLIVEALVERGQRPVILGRRPDALAQISTDFGGLQSAIADVRDAGSLASVLQEGDVLISSVGPFQRLGWAAAEAAANTGAHYLDTTGEVGFVRDLTVRLDATARQNSSLMVPAFGYDYVPGLIAGALAAGRAGAAAHRIRVGYFATGPLRRGLSSGTRSTMGDGLLEPSFVYRDGDHQEARTGSRTATFQVRGASRRSFLVSGTEVLALPRAFPALASVEVFNGWFPAAAPLVPTVSALASTIAGSAGGRKLVERLSAVGTKVPGGGPDAAERARTKTHVTAIVSDDRDRTIETVHVEGPSIYSLTAHLIAAGAERITEGAPAVGVQDPFGAFGVNGLIALGESVGLRETSA